MYTLLAILFTTATPNAASLQANDLKAIDGEWVYVEDRTPGRTLEQISPPMGSTFTLKVEEGAVILVWGHGGGKGNVRVSLDGTPTEIPGTTPGEVARYKGVWKDGAFTYEVVYVRTQSATPGTFIKREFRPTKEGLIVRSNLGTGSELGPVALYQHPQDIPMPTPAKATITDVSWISGAWVGSRGTGGAISFEERWSPPKGGSMLATSRTVNRDRLSAFEFLRIVERDGGLVYIAQPNGAAPTEFILSELTGKRAVFDNPRHDYPKRIIYELTAEGGLTATIGYIKGGTPRKFEFKKES
ncbi:MAG TPA: DUF6265 family protein [Fimbriimonadaceae bacterium]|nr:DUF6265 family protein [Fimbriimonadaceae bacterium]